MLEAFYIIINNEVIEINKFKDFNKLYKSYSIDINYLYDLYNNENFKFILILLYNIELLKNAFINYLNDNYTNNEYIKNIENIIKELK